MKPTSVADVLARATAGMVGSDLDVTGALAQVDEGPRLDPMRVGEEVHQVGAETLVARWPLAGPYIVASGYRSAQARAQAGTLDARPTS